MSFASEAPEIRGALSSKITIASEASIKAAPRTVATLGWARDSVH